MRRKAVGAAKLRADVFGGMVDMALSRGQCAIRRPYCRIRNISNLRGSSSRLLWFCKFQRDWEYEKLKLCFSRFGTGIQIARHHKMDARPRVHLAQEPAHANFASGHGGFQFAAGAGGTHGVAPALQAVCPAERPCKSGMYSSRE